MSHLKLPRSFTCTLLNGDVRTTGSDRPSLVSSSSRLFVQVCDSSALPMSSNDLSGQSEGIDDEPEWPEDPAAVSEWGETLVGLSLRGSQGQRLSGVRRCAACH